MRPFVIQRVDDADGALQAMHAARSRFIAGGTTLIDLMRQNVEEPDRLIALNRVPLTVITAHTDGGITIGALATNSDVAHHPAIRSGFSVLSEAILSGATTQITHPQRTDGRPEPRNPIQLTPLRRVLADRCTGVWLA